MLVDLASKNIFIISMVYIAHHLRFILYIDGDVTTLLSPLY